MQCEQNDIDVVDTQFEAVTFEVALGVGEIGRVGLGLDHVLFARNAFQGLSQIDVRAVLIGDVKEADAMVKRMADDAGEFLDPEPGLVAGLSAADAAGAHPHQRDLDARFTQRHRVGGALGQGGLGAAAVPAKAVVAYGHRGGCRNGGLGHEITAIQRGCHEVFLPGVMR